MTRHLKQPLRKVKKLLATMPQPDSISQWGWVTHGTFWRQTLCQKGLLAWGWAVKAARALHGPLLSLSQAVSLAALMLELHFCGMLRRQTSKRCCHPLEVTLSHAVWWERTFKSGSLKAIASHIPSLTRPTRSHHSDHCWRHLSNCGALNTGQCQWLG